MTRNFVFALGRLVAALAVGYSAGSSASAFAPPVPAKGFYIDVALTARATQLLRQRHATVVVSVWYSWDSANGANMLGDETLVASDVPVRVHAKASPVAGSNRRDINVGAGLNKISGGASTQNAGLACINGMKIPLAQALAQPLILYCRAADELAVPGHEPLMPPGVRGKWKSGYTLTMSGHYPGPVIPNSSWTFTRMSR